MRIDEKQRRMVLTGNIWKAVIYITAPLFFYQFIINFYNIIDQMMVSSINSESVSAVATIAQIKNLISSIGSGLAAGGTLVVARLYGAGKINEARKNANVVFSMASIVCILILTIMLPLSNHILTLAKVPDELIKISDSYFKLQLVEQVVIVLNSLFISLEKAKCNTKIIFVSNIIIMAVKLILNSLFIYGFKITNLVFVELASLLSQCVMLTIGCFRLFSKNNIFKISFKELSLKWESVKKIILFSFPLFLSRFVMSFGKVTVNAMCGIYGSLTVGALGISNNLGGIVTGPCLAIEEAESTMVSQNLGNKNMKRTFKIFKANVIVSLSWAFIGFLFIRILFQDQIIGLFNISNKSPDFEQMIKDIFYYDCLTIPALAINYVVLGLLYGYGQTFLATVNNVLRIVTRILTLWILQTYFPNIGAEAAGISMGISNIIIALFAIVFFVFFLIKIKIKGYKGMHFKDKEPEMVEVDGILVNKEVL